AYVYDPDGHLNRFLNAETLVTTPVTVDHWEAQLKRLIADHVTETRSSRATEIMRRWDEELANFVQVCPKEMLERLPAPLTRDTPAQSA
ncbi:MAG: hypothetical protein GY952_09005, partial [Rhodobacteraceae bacterium]|nr:hypothetical protein [Paracoccaceae bacterium]